MNKESLISSLVEEKTKAPFRKMRSGSHSFNGLRLDYPGMDTVVSLIKQIILKYRGKEFVREKALDITRSIPEDPRTGHPNRRNFDAIADAIHDWIVQNIAYVRDQNGIERIQTPDATLRLRTGDCDDMVILSAVLLESLGVPTRIKLIGEGREFTHIYAEYLANGQWKSFDPTLALYPGYVIPKDNIKAEKTVPIERPEIPLSKTRNTKRSTRSHFIHN